MLINEKFKKRDNFAGGDKKHLNHFLRSYEEKVINTLLPRVPLGMSTVHLTLMTFFWAAGVVFFGYLAGQNINWLWGFSVCIFLQHITDMLDGAVGRARHEGLVKWGFYADHFLDYVFICAIVTGYSFLLPLSFLPLVLACLAVCGGFMIHVFLDFSITNDFKISFNRFGVSEVRYVLIAFNTLLIILGRELLINIFPLFVAVAAVALGIVVYRSQKIYRAIDMSLLREERKNRLPRT